MYTISCTLNIYISSLGKLLVSWACTESCLCLFVTEEITPKTQWLRTTIIILLFPIVPVSQEFAEGLAGWALLGSWDSGSLAELQVTLAGGWSWDKMGTEAPADCWHNLGFAGFLSENSLGHSTLGAAGISLKELPGTDP